MATKATSKKTDAELDADIKKAEEKIEALKKQKYETKLTNELASLRLPDLVKKVKDNIGKGLTDVVLLDAIGNAAGLKGFVVTAKAVTKGDKKGGGTRVQHSQETKDKVVAAVKAGKTKSAVAKEFGVSLASVNSWTKPKK